MLTEKIQALYNELIPFENFQPRSVNRSQTLGETLIEMKAIRAKYEGLSDIVEKAQEIIDIIHVVTFAYEFDMA